MSERANRILSRENIGELSWPDMEDFSQIARQLGVAETEAEVDFLDSWPTSLQQCILGVLKSAVQNEPRIPVTMCWVPDYDYSVSVWDAHATADSARAITMVLRSPYPGSAGQRAG